ncbi:MAG: hypothetical protein GY711_08060 [bacterium]|nr:hypothetical protein [bacterium]
MTLTEPNEVRPTRSTVGRLGVFASNIAAAALWNPWTADWLLGSAWIEARSTRMGLLAVGVGLLLWSFYALLRPPSRIATRISTLLFTLFLVVPLASEGLVRIGIAADFSGLRKEWHYADRLSDDDYYKLRDRWNPRPRSRTLHPVLGWRRLATPSDPLAIHHKPGYTVRTEDVVLCYGDSFMVGTTPIPHKIPDVIDATLPQWTAYNFATGGHGVGQMYLRFRESHAQFVDPIIVVGIMVFDLDRTILCVRDRPKPCFRLRDGELVLEGPPLPTDADILTLRGFSDTELQLVGTG